MAYDQHYKGVIWTNHAIERLKQRRLDQATAWKAFQYPDVSLKGKQSGTIEYQKRFGKSLVTIIATKNEKKKWIILSCWVDPPLAGSIDIQKKKDYIKYKKAGFWGRLWIDIRKQVFGF